MKLRSKELHERLLFLEAVVSIKKRKKVNAIILGRETGEKMEQLFSVRFSFQERRGEI